MDLRSRTHRRNIQKKVLPVLLHVRIYHGRMQHFKGTCQKGEIEKRKEYIAFTKIETKKKLSDDEVSNQHLHDSTKCSQQQIISPARVESKLNGIDSPSFEKGITSSISKQHQSEPSNENTNSETCSTKSSSKSFDNSTYCDSSYSNDSLPTENRDEIKKERNASSDIESSESLNESLENSCHSDSSYANESFSSETL